MKRFWSGCLMLLLVTCTSSPSASVAEKPHVLLILADDLGYGDLGCYNADAHIPTPNLDALAREGMRLTDAHSPSSVCTPTRYGILTGRYAWRTPLKQGVLWTYDPSLIAPDQNTLAHLFKSQGYRTAVFGKWHLGWDWPVKVGHRTDTFPIGYKAPALCQQLEAAIDLSQPLKGGPLSAGFDDQFGVDVPNFPPYCFIEDGRIVGAVPQKMKPDTIYGNQGLMQEGWDLHAVLPTICRRANAYIRDHLKTKADQPFFVYLPLTSPHTPIVPNEAFLGKSRAGDYGDLVAEVDTYVGEWIQTLKEAGAYDNTLIIFTSDNGSCMRAGDLHQRGPEWHRVGSVKSMFGHDSNAPLRGMKADIWEGGHRVPFIASWPGHIPAHIQREGLFSLTDFMATFAHLLGVDLPAGDAEDSRDQWPLLRGDSLPVPARDHLISHSGNGVFAVRKGLWKLIDGKHSGGWSYSQKLDTFVASTPGQLYHLGEDLGETHNVFAEQPEKVAELRSLLLEAGVKPVLLPNP